MKSVRPFARHVFVFIVLLAAVIGSRLITQFSDNMVKQVALSHIRHDVTGLSTIDKSRPLSTLTSEQMASAIEGRKLVDEARKYMSWFSVAAHTAMLIIFTVLLIKFTKKDCDECHRT